MAAPRFFNLPRTVAALLVAGNLAVLAIGKPAPWWVVLPILALLLLGHLNEWRLEIQLHNQRGIAAHYEAALRDLRKELDRG